MLLQSNDLWLKPSFDKLNETWLSGKCAVCFNATIQRTFINTDGIYVGGGGKKCDIVKNAYNPIQDQR